MPKNSENLLKLNFKKLHSLRILLRLILCLLNAVGKLTIITVEKN